MAAGGLEIEVVEPFEHLTVTYEGEVCLLDDPGQMADPRKAFTDEPVGAVRGRPRRTRRVARCTAARRTTTTAAQIEVDAEKSFAKAHYEQHTAVIGTITVGDEMIDARRARVARQVVGPSLLAGPALVPLAADDRSAPDFAMMLSIIDVDGSRRRSGMVLEDGDYAPIRDCRDRVGLGRRRLPDRDALLGRDRRHEYEVTGEVISLIPLRNRRSAPDGSHLPPGSPRR